MSQGVESIFHAAREMSPERRAGYLDGVCGNDVALRSKVEALLRADDEAGGFLRTIGDETADVLPGSGGDPVRVPAESQEEPGEQIGRYKLLQQIGEGGFGTVWMAEQKEPVRRRVALKIIKLGMDTKQVIARFEAERQALAMMDHPNIAKVLDAGATETGRPYFVMEYIKGVPILEYCDTEKLDTRARLNLFVKVCQAIQHAHQKGIIHRDIKPTNVLVTMHDGVPVPKVIDFGIAKATNQELTERTLFTQHRQMIGTPAYMSPEQAEMSGLDIDTRSDIYSLGVLLYELLTGTTPFDGKSLMEAGFAEMMRIIREETPHKPSTRLSSLGETATQTAQLRRADIGGLSTSLRGDVDWIVMKCLEKDRTRRYETASGLAADIHRHLSDEPVSARPPSTMYRVRKFVRRNRGQVIGAGVLLTILVLGVVGTSYGMVWALREKGRADQQAAIAAAAAERAERELARATEIKGLITDMLTSVNPERARTADTTLLRGILEDASGRLSGGGVTDELVAAELHQVVGGAYLSLGRPNDAEPHIAGALEIRRRLLGDDDPETIRSLHNLAMVFWSLNRFAEGERLYREAYETSSRALGPDDPITLASRGNLALILTQQRRFRDAEPLLREALESYTRVRGPADRNTLACKGNLAFLSLELYRYAEAETLFTNVVETATRSLGETHPVTLDAMRDLGRLYTDQGRYADAEPLLVKTLETQRAVLGDGHPETQQAKAALARLYMETGRLSEAEPLIADAARTEERLVGTRHPYTLEFRARLARLYNTTERPAEAIAAIEPVMPTIREFLRIRNPITHLAVRELARAYLQTGRRDEALGLQRELCDALVGMAEEDAAPAHTIDQAARALLETDFDGIADPPRALRLAKQACDKAAKGDPLWRYLDTLALAEHLTGDTAAAVETQQRAISLMPSPDADPGMRERLAEYEAALSSTGG